MPEVSRSQTDFLYKRKKGSGYARLAWSDRVLGGRRYRFFGAGAYIASDNALRLKSGLATRDYS